jgi:thiol-disulfide isomerase/thioredoxin
MCFNRIHNMPKFLAILMLIFASGSLPAQKAEMVKLKDLQALIEKPSEKVKVINFWATWCAPCVKEMPFFEKLNQENSNVEVTLVSMDYDLDPNPEKVYRFISRKNLQSKVLILTEQNPNQWIDKIDKTWSGALPATLIINPKTGKRKLIQKELHEGDLEKYIDEVL